ncbi:hypothetical protein D3C87_1325070 [compost metagenome]
MANAANQLPAVAPAGAPTDLVGFEQHYAQAALGQLERRVQSGEPATDHAHIGHQVALQHRVIRLRQTAGGVIGRRVPMAWDRLLSTGIHVRVPDSGV